MTISEFISLPDALLVDAMNNASTVIFATPANYAISTTNATALGTRAAEFQSKFDEVYTAKLAYESAVRAKAVARESLTTFFSTLLTQSVNTPTVTDANLALINISARQPRTVRPLRQPLNLVVAPRPTGVIEASWKRNQNSAATVFVLQQLSSENEWETVWQGTRIRAVLEGYAAGVPVTFRVIATKSDEFSEPSATFTIYGAGGDGTLRIAA